MSYAKVSGVLDDLDYEINNYIYISRIDVLARGTKLMKDSIKIVTNAVL